MKNAIILFGLVTAMVRKASATCASAPAGYDLVGGGNAKCSVSSTVWMSLRTTKANSIFFQSIKGN